MSWWILNTLESQVLNACSILALLEGGRDWELDQVRGNNAVH